MGPAEAGAAPSVRQSDAELSDGSDSQGGPAQPFIAPAQAPTQSHAPASGGGRHHTVAKGDTLYSLAQRYYGNRSRWREILAANKGVLPGESAPLKIGMDLKIP